MTESSLEQHSATRGRTYWRTLLFRILAIGVGLLPFLAAEVVLRLCDLPKKQAAVDPYVDLHSLSPLFEENDGQMVIGENRLHLFRPTSFTRAKPPEVFRVFALGGSTTQGEPYSTETSFPKWTQLCLQSASQRQIEMINCGGLSYASYRVLAILREVLQYDPDLIIVYTGHNEFLEKRSYQGLELSDPANQIRGWVGAMHLVRFARETLMGPASRQNPLVENPTALKREVDALLDYQGGLEAYQRDDAYDAGVVSHFAWNLRTIINECDQAAVPLVLVAPVRNILDCPPFKIQADPRLTDDQLDSVAQAWELARETEDRELALDAARGVLKLDDRHSGALYLIGRDEYEKGNWEEAKRFLGQATDNDVCKLRAPMEIRSVVISLAEQMGVACLDAQSLFEGISRHGIVGNAWLVDHIHPSVEGHQKLGEALTETILSAGMIGTEVSDWKADSRIAWRKHFDSLNEAYFERGNQRLEGLLRWTQGRAKKVRDAQAD
ncbi:MAG: hypothetical protein ACE361_11605 [Aureliella sp.]